MGKHGPEPIDAPNRRGANPRARPLAVGDAGRRVSRRRRHGARRLRFTREGKWFIALTLAVGFAAINTGNNLLYLVLGMLLSLIIVSGILSENALRGLTVARRLPDRVYARRPFLAGISLTNGKKQLPSFSIEVEDVITDRPLAKKCYFLKVPAGACQHTSYRGEFRYRGLYRFEAFLVSTRYPFAFFRKSRVISSAEEIIVLPHVHPVSELPEEILAVNGDSQQTRRGAGRDFYGLRDYHDGDDARDIHWKRSAREARLVLREYEAESRHRTAVCLNDALTVPPTPDNRDEIEQCVEMAASIAVRLAKRGHTVTLLTPDLALTIDPDGRGLQQALRALALVEFRHREPSDRISWPVRLEGERSMLVTHRAGLPLLATDGFTQIHTIPKV